MLQILNPFKAGQEFQKLKSKKKWILALVFVFAPIVLSAVGNNLIQQKNQEIIQQSVGEMTQNRPQGGGPGGQGGPSRNIMDPFFRVSRGGMGAGGGGTGIVILGIALSAVIAGGFWVLKSVVFHMGSKVLGGEGVKMSSTIHVLAYTYIPFVFKGILDILRGIIYRAPSSVEELFQLRSNGMGLNFVRDYFNIFMLWALILMVIAVREQYNLNNKKAALVVLLPYLAVWILRIVSMRSGGLLGGLI